jgi:hypothetical protein
MAEELFEPQQSSRILAKISEGMTVYDRTGNNIGTVEYVYLGAVSEEADKRGEGPATTSAPRRAGSSLIDDFAKAIIPSDQVSEALRERLLRHGFIRIDSAGLFAADRYVLPGQIVSVSGNRINLAVTHDELILQKGG